MASPYFSRARVAEPEQFSVRHQGDTFRIKVTRRASARRFSLRVSTATGDVVLTLPPRGNFDRAKAFAESHGGWIATRVKRLPERVPFEAGAIVPVRGKPHRIVHRQARRGAPSLGEDAKGEAILAIYCEPPHLARRVREFLSAMASEALAQSVRRYTKALGMEACKITVKDTVSRWGSCSSSGRLSFSWRLIMAPHFVLDYLAAHEVAHLKEMNHSTRYWRIVAGLCPAWKEAERWLKRNGSGLHRYG